VRKSQDAALDAARAGHFSGKVDDAARAVIVNGGYGPDYKFFTTASATESDSTARASVPCPR